jgi:hypothetical protein
MIRFGKHIPLQVLLVFLLIACGLQAPAVQEPPSPTPLAPTATSARPTTVPKKTAEVIPTSTPAFRPTVGPTSIPPSPTPTEVYKLELEDWPPLTLREWPRPAGDNGLCIHFIPYQYHSEEHLDLHIARMVSMKMKWALVIYADEIQLEMAATKFRDAGIGVVWRRMLYPDERYFDWGRDVELLKSLGVPPYMQIYNEPSVEVLWEDPPVSKDRLMRHLLLAARDVYNAGGFVGLQLVDGQWLRDVLYQMRLHGGEPIFGRMFFVPHPYGLNHPPSYQEDPNAVLGFLHFAHIFQQELGFVPPMIAGEGGWKYGASDDDRFPRINDELHRDYHFELFNWFSSGILSNGEPLPDYLFAFCPWLLASPMDDSAWFDSFAGDRALTIEAVSNMPPFVRRFGWD